VVERDRLKAGIAELVAELDDLPELVEAHLVHGDVSKNAFSAEFNKAVALISRHKPNGGAAWRRRTSFSTPKSRPSGIRPSERCNITATRALSEHVEAYLTTLVKKLRRKAAEGRRHMPMTMDERLDHAPAALTTYFAEKGEPPRAADADYETRT
jgi:hypothetical protein